MVVALYMSDAFAIVDRGFTIKPAVHYYSRMVTQTLHYSTTSRTDAIVILRNLMIVISFESQKFEAK